MFYKILDQYTFQLEVYECYQVSCFVSGESIYTINLILPSINALAWNLMLISFGAQSTDRFPSYFRKFEVVVVVSKPAETRQVGHIRHFFTIPRVCVCQACSFQHLIRWLIPATWSGLWLQHPRSVDPSLAGSTARLSSAIIVVIPGCFHHSETRSQPWLQRLRSAAKSPLRVCLCFFVCVKRI